MPKVDITQDLCELIHSERKKRKIVGSTLSRQLGKNTSFISNLEKGTIKYLDLDLLFNIFDTLIDLPDEEKNKYIYELITSLSVKYSKKEISEKEWLLTFDMQKRLFPITDKMREIIKDLRKEVGISEIDLVNEINKNKGVDKNIKTNHLKLLIKDGMIIGNTIRFEFEKNYIKDIEEGKIEEINYINLLGIIYNLFVLKDMNQYDATIMAEQILNENGIYTLLDRDKEIEKKAQELSAKGQNFKTYELDPTIYAKDLGEAMQNLNKKFYRMRDLDIAYAFKMISQFDKNLEQCFDLTFRLIGLNFTELKDLDIKDKREFLKEINKLIEKYKNEYISKNELSLENL